MRDFLQGLRAFPTLLRIGFAEAMAYRAEMIVWMLTSTLPLVSMALWSAVAAGRRIGPEGFSSADFVAYFLLTLVVRFVLLIVELVWIQKLDSPANPRRLLVRSESSSLGPSERRAWARGGARSRSVGVHLPTDRPGLPRAGKAGRIIRRSRLCPFESTSWRVSWESRAKICWIRSRNWGC